MSKSRAVGLQKVLWKRYVWERQTMAQLAKRYNRSERWIRQQLDKAPVSKAKVKGQRVVVVADMTFSKRAFGICVFRAVHLRKNLYWAVGSKETAGIYDECRRRLEDLGFEISAVVVDGKPGIIEVFWDIPIQMCHFHQSAIMTRYLTTRPKLAAGQELRAIVLTMRSSTQEQLQDSLNSWYKQWELFLKEKTFNPETRRWHYTHKRLRSAYKSITRNLLLLYTYQRHPELNIPNTTNSLDGTFAHLKGMLHTHRGLKRTRKLKLIHEILSK